MLTGTLQATTMPQYLMGTYRAAKLLFHLVDSTVNFYCMCIKSL